MRTGKKAPVYKGGAAIITGSASGIGRALGIELGKRGVFSCSGMVVHVQILILDLAALSVMGINHLVKIFSFTVKRETGISDPAPGYLVIQKFKSPYFLHFFKGISIQGIGAGKNQYNLFSGSRMQPKPRRNIVSPVLKSVLYCICSPSHPLNDRRVLS